MPNDDVAAPRKLRIRKAMEFGALWVREWRENITHVIVDRNICYQDVLKFLKIPSLPVSVSVGILLASMLNTTKPNMILVNEIYPSDCLTYRFMVNPGQDYYRVNGHNAAPVAQHFSSLNGSSETSLQIKSKRPKDSDQREFSSSNEISEELCVGPIPDQNVSTMVHLRAISSSPDLPIHPQNALEEAIEEAKAVQDLVSWMS